MKNSVSDRISATAQRITLFARPISLAIGIALIGSTAVQAQGIPVFDATALAKHLQQIKALQAQLEQAKRLYDTANQTKNSLNGITDIKDLASLLNNREFQQYLPKEYNQYSGAMNGLLQGKVEGLEKKYDYYQHEGKTAANEFYYNELKRRKGETYQDMAVGQAVYDQASKRSEGLNELKAKLATASTPKQVFDLQARISAESALLQNDINRMQGLAMIQEARNRVDREREGQNMQKIFDQMDDEIRRKK